MLGAGVLGGAQMAKMHRIKTSAKKTDVHDMQVDDGDARRKRDLRSLGRFCRAAEADASTFSLGFGRTDGAFLRHDPSFGFRRDHAAVGSELARECRGNIACKQASYANHRTMRMLAGKIFGSTQVLAQACGWLAVRLTHL